MDVEVGAYKYTFVQVSKREEREIELFNWFVL